MDERWDNDLTKRIKEVFDNYDDTSADEGWQLLRERYPEKAKRRVAGWIWLSGAAALLLLFIGILWLRSGKNDNGQQLAHSTKPAKQDTISQIAKTNRTNQHPDSSAIQKTNQTGLASNTTDKTFAKNPAAVRKVVNKTNRGQTEITTSKPNDIAKITAPAATKQQQANVKKRTSTPSQSNTIANAQPMNNQQGNKPGSELPAITGNNNAIANAQPKNNQQVNKRGSEMPAIAGNDNVIANAQAKNNQQAQNPVSNTKIDTSKRYNIVNNQPGVNMVQEQQKKQHSIFDNDNNVASNQKEPEKKLPKDKFVKFGIYAATYFNYAKGSNNQFNIGAGVTSDIRISENLKLSTGISIAQNSLSYAQLPLQQSAAAPAVLSTSSASFYNVQSLYTVSTPRFNSYDADLVGLDIPLNLKYVFNPEKGGTYILAGVSSGAFINEKYTYSYNNPSLFNANVAQAQDQSTTSNFGSFYFARTLNVAFGTGYKLGGNQLTVEPFLKYPLEGLGTQELKFGAGGINLKFDFNVKKK